MSDRSYELSRKIATTLLLPSVRLKTWRVSGALEPAGPAVVVANHISHFDPIFLGLSFRRPIDWMTTEEFYDKPLLATLLRTLNTFPVDRSRPDQRALRRAVERLRAGRFVGVFPEGGIRAGSGSVLEGAVPKRGATALARLAGVPMITCVILGTDRLYAARSWMPGIARTCVWVAVGAPLILERKDGPDADARMAAALRHLAAATVAHFSLGPDDWPATPEHRRGREAKPCQVTQ